MVNDQTCFVVVLNQPDMFKVLTFWKKPYFNQEIQFFYVKTVRN